MMQFRFRLALLSAMPRVEDIGGRVVKPVDGHGDRQRSHSLRRHLPIVHSSTQRGRGALPDGHGGTCNLRRPSTAGVALGATDLDGLFAQRVR
jgi:hypothetical protein